MTTNSCSPARTWVPHSALALRWRTSLDRELKAPSWMRPCDRGRVSRCARAGPTSIPKFWGPTSSRARLAVALPIGSISAASHFRLPPNGSSTLTPNMTVGFRVIGPAFSALAPHTKAHRKARLAISPVFSCRVMRSSVSGLAQTARIGTSNFGGAISRTETTWSTLSARLIRSRAPRAFRPRSESRFAVLSDHARLAHRAHPQIDASIGNRHRGRICVCARYARHDRGITNAQSADASNAQIRMNNGGRIVFAPHPAASYRVIISERRVPAKRGDILLTAHSRARSDFLLHDLRQRLSTKDIPTVAHAANHLGEVVRMREVVG